MMATCCQRLLLVVTCMKASGFVFKLCRAVVWCVCVAGLSGIGTSFSFLVCGCNRSCTIAKKVMGKPFSWHICMIGRRADTTAVPRGIGFLGELQDAYGCVLHPGCVLNALCLQLAEQNSRAPPSARAMTHHVSRCR